MPGGPQGNIGGPFGPRGFVSPVDVTVSDRDRAMLAAIAQTETDPLMSRQDQLANMAMVVQTVMSRVADPNFPDTVEGVITEDRGRQFSPVMRGTFQAALTQGPMPEAFAMVDAVTTNPTANPLLGNFQNPNFATAQDSRDFWGTVPNLMGHIATAPTTQNLLGWIGDPAVSRSVHAFGLVDPMVNTPFTVNDPFAEAPVMTAQTTPTAPPSDLGSLAFSQTPIGQQNLGFTAPSMTPAMLSGELAMADHAQRGFTPALMGFGDFETISVSPTPAPTSPQMGHLGQVFGTPAAAVPSQGFTQGVPTSFADFSPETSIAAMGFTAPDFGGFPANVLGNVQGVVEGVPATPDPDHIGMFGTLGMPSISAAMAAQEAQALGPEAAQAIGAQVAQGVGAVPAPSVAAQPAVSVGADVHGVPTEGWSAETAVMGSFPSVAQGITAAPIGALAAPALADFGQEATTAAPAVPGVETLGTFGTIAGLSPTPAPAPAVAAPEALEGTPADPLGGLVADALSPTAPAEAAAISPLGQFASISPDAITAADPGIGAMVSLTDAEPMADRGYLMGMMPDVNDTTAIFSPDPISQTPMPAPVAIPTVSPVVADPQPVQTQTQTQAPLPVAVAMPQQQQTPQLDFSPVPVVGDPAPVGATAAAQGAADPGGMVGSPAGVMGPVGSFAGDPGQFGWGMSGIGHIGGDPSQSTAGFSPGHLGFGSSAPGFAEGFAAGISEAVGGLFGGLGGMLGGLGGMGGPGGGVGGGVAGGGVGAIGGGIGGVGDAASGVGSAVGGFN